MKYKLLLTLSLLQLLFVGCTKENLSACDVNTKTAFKCIFELNNDRTDQFSTLVNKVDLYIFNESGLLVKHIASMQDTLPPPFIIESVLENGKYTAVLYGSVNGKNEVVVGTKQGDVSTPLAGMKEKESMMSQMRLMLSGVNGYSDKSLDVVLHGMVSNFEVLSKDSTLNVYFTRNTNLIDLNINGLEYLLPDGVPVKDVAVRIEAKNRTYLHDNTLDLEMGDIVYGSYMQDHANKVLKSQFSVLRLFKEQSMILKVYNGNDVVWSLDLMAEILKSPKYATNEDLDREDKFVISVVVGMDKDFTITVNGWTTTGQDESIG